MRNPGPPDPIADAAGAFTDWLQERRAIPPHEKAIDHAAWGAGAIGFAVYFLLTIWTDIERPWLIGFLALAGGGSPGTAVGSLSNSDATAGPHRCLFVGCPARSWQLRHCQLVALGLV